MPFTAMVVRPRANTTPIPASPTALLAQKAASKTVKRAATSRLKARSHTILNASNGETNKMAMAIARLEAPDVIPHFALVIVLSTAPVKNLRADSKKIIRSRPTVAKTDRTYRFRPRSPLLWSRKNMVIVSLTFLAAKPVP